MSDKSHVGMGYSLCPVCGIKHSEVVLLDKRLKDTLTQHEFMGFDLCPEHEAMREEYIALVEIKATPQGTNAKPKDVHNSRTGLIAHVKRPAFKEIFNVDVPDTQPMAYVEVGVIDQLKGMQQEGE